jgi:hypothetical protein
MKEQKKDVEEFKLTKELFDLYWHFPEKLPMFYYYRDHYWYLHPQVFVQIVEDYLTDCEDVIGDLHSLINGETEDFFNTLVEDTIH